MTKQEQEWLRVAGDFLSRYYHEEPDDVEGTIEALADNRERHHERAEIARAFKGILSMSMRRGKLAEFVRQNANRFAQTDEEAREFLERIWAINLFEIALRLEET